MSIRGLGSFPPGTVMQQFFIPRTDGPGNHPHACDAYIPQGGPKHALVVLHGGGGSKRSQAVFCRTLKTKNLVLTPEDINWKRLYAFSTMEIYPLGQRCLPSNAVDNPWNPNGVDSRVPQRPDGVTAWSQGYFWSSANDPQFLKDVKDWVFNNFPTVDYIHIHGHSAGGMMAKYMWRFEPQVFHTHSTVSGPTPFYWDPTPFAPTVLKPMWMQMGAKDTILGLLDGIAGPGDHWLDATWRQQPPQLSYINVKGAVNPVTGKWVPQLQEIIPDWREFERAANLRASRRGFASPGPFVDSYGIDYPAKTGTTRIWSYDSDFIKLRKMTEPDHNYYDHQKLMLSEAGGKPTSVISEVMTWAIAQVNAPVL